MGSDVISRFGPTSPRHFPRHPPPILVEPEVGTTVLSQGRSALLGVGSGGRVAAPTPVPRGAAVLFYSDGLVEDRTRSITDGIAVLIRNLEGDPDLATKLEILADRMVASDEPDDTCALSLLHLPAGASE